MKWGGSRRLKELKTELASLQRLNRRVRDISGKTTALTVQNMGKLNQRIIEVKLEIKELEDDDL